MTDFSTFDYFAKEDNFAKKKNITSIPIFSNTLSGSTITIAIPTCCRARTLVDALESALNQVCFNDYNIMVVDDGGERNDETEQFMAQFRTNPRVSYYKNTSKLAMAGNFNRIAELSETEYIVILHDDDILSPNYLKKIYPFAVSNNADIVTVDTIIWEETNEARPVFEDQNTASFVRMKPAYMFNLCRCLPTGLLIKRNTVLNEGGFDARLHPSIDYVFLAKAFFKYRAYRYKEKLLIYRWAENVSIKLESQKLFIYIDHYFKIQLGKKLNYPKWFIKFVCKKDAQIRYKRITEDYGPQEIYLDGKILTYPSIPWRIVYKLYDTIEYYRYRFGL